MTESRRGEGQRELARRTSGDGDGEGCDSPAKGSAILADPEADDGSEERFAASLDEPGFAEEERAEIAAETAATEGEGPKPEQETGARVSAEQGAKPAVADFDDSSLPLWKQEVSDRLHRFRARRTPRAPRYPSLRLKFEARESKPAATGASAALPIEPCEEASPEPVFAENSALPRLERAAQPEKPAAEAARIIEFPRSYAPPARPDEIAEPVMDRPRIVEAPEVIVPPPALGGIILEATAEGEKRPEIELPLNAAPVGRRMLANVVDGGVVGGAFGIFGWVFHAITHAVPPGWQVVAPAGAALALFWGAYQYLLVVYTGSTPGARTAALRLCRFDGGAPNRRLRHWRVLASMLSAVPLGLGIWWCYFDEDGLCWHDRITRTYYAR